MRSTRGAGAASTGAATAAVCNRASPAGGVEKGDLMLHLLSLAMGAGQWRIRFFNAANDFKFSLAAQASVLINRHIVSKPRKWYHEWILSYVHS
jgi:hypothetical protein